MPNLGHFHAYIALMPGKFNFIYSFNAYMVLLPFDFTDRCKYRGQILDFILISPDSSYSILFPKQLDYAHNSLPTELSCETVIFDDIIQKHLNCLIT